VIAKPITLLGAQKGVDARTGRANPAAESVIDSGGKTGIQVTGTTGGVTIDGFTIRNAALPASMADGIDAFGGGSGFTITNNVITRFSFGVNMNSNGSTRSVVTRNRFAENNGAGGNGGVCLCCGPANDLSISENLFTGHVGDAAAAVNTAGAADRQSTGLRIERNQSVDDATFAPADLADLRHDHRQHGRARIGRRDLPGQRRRGRELRGHADGEPEHRERGRGLQRHRDGKQVGRQHRDPEHPGRALRAPVTRY
jgi:hypothetical protein